MPIEYFDKISTNTTRGNQLCRQAQALKFGDIHIHMDAKTQLLAIIAVHSLHRGPAIGGCRLKSYASIEDAIEDAMNLAQMMSYKSAIIDLPHGGAKAVIVEPKSKYDRTALLKNYAKFVDTLNGKYITAVDSGTSPEDMDIIATCTPHVLCTTPTKDTHGNASLHTAAGVLRGIEAAVKFKLGQTTLHGMHIAIQGAGEVGHFLAEKLTARGAHLTMADINTDNLKRCVKEFKVKTVAPDAIYQIPCDVFSPCALGGTLNKETIPQLQTSIVAGSANNQLATAQDGEMLYTRGILYTPDFVINAGGLIYAAGMYKNADVKTMDNDVDKIYDRLMAIFERAVTEGSSTCKVVNLIAEEKLYAE